MYCIVMIYHKTGFSQGKRGENWLKYDVAKCKNGAPGEYGLLSRHTADCLRNVRVCLRFFEDDGADILPIESFIASVGAFEFPQISK